MFFSPRSFNAGSIQAQIRFNCTDKLPRSFSGMHREPPSRDVPCPERGGRRKSHANCEMVSYSQEKRGKNGSKDDRKRLFSTGDAQPWRTFFHFPFSISFPFRPVMQSGNVCTLDAWLNKWAKRETHTHNGNSFICVLWEARGDTEHYANSVNM